MRKVALACMCLALMASSADARHHHKWVIPQRHNPPVSVARTEGVHFRGMASYYGREFSGRKTACGIVYRPTLLIAASRTLPCGEIVQITNMRNGRHMNVTILDRGPYAGGRILDVSETVAKSLGFVYSGTTEVDVQRLTYRN